MPTYKEVLFIDLNGNPEDWWYLGHSYPNLETIEEKFPGRSWFEFCVPFYVSISARVTTDLENKCIWIDDRVVPLTEEQYKQLLITRIYHSL